MKISIVAACLLLVGGLLVTGTAAQAAPQKTKAPVHKAEWTSGTLEKFDPVLHSIVVKHAGKEMTFTLGDKAGVMHGKQKVTVPELASDIGKPVKVEYSTANGAKTANLIEIRGPVARPVKPAVKK